jgi:hypothetical protein
MSSDATTFPLRKPLLGDARQQRDAAGEGDHDSDSAQVASRRAVVIAATALLTILVCSLLIVIVAADRPSFPPTHAHFFPGWLAGPLGGLWPGFPRGEALKYLFTVSLATMYVAYLLGLRYMPRLPARWVIAAVVIVHAIFFLAPPLALTDIFNYVNYARMEVVHHLNPYTTVPIYEPHNDPSFDLSNWHLLLSPYGPLFTLITFAVVPLGVAASFWAFKGILMIASLGTILLVWKCARLLGRDPVQAIVFAGLNPVVLVWGLGGDHNDFIMMFLVMLSFYLLLRGGVAGVGGGSSGEPEILPLQSHGQAVPQGNGSAALGHEGSAAAGHEAEAPAAHGLLGRLGGLLFPLTPLELGAGAALVAAVAVKASAAILLPVVLAGLMRAPRRLVQVILGMVAAGAVVAGVSVMVFGLHLPDLSTQGRLVTAWSPSNLIGLAMGSGGETVGLRHALSLVLIASVALACVLAWRKRDSLTAAGWASVALWVTLSWVLPWYVLWALPMAALSRSRSLRTTVLAFGVFFALVWAPLAGNFFNSIGFEPEKTSLGQLHQRYVKELLN